jgi:hypothetical protein
MAEVLADFPDVVVVDSEGHRYHAHASGAEMPDGKWQGWIEFIPTDGGVAVRSGRETTQPNRTDTVYWATGLSPVYLEGALKRALKPVVVHHAVKDSPRFEEPAPVQHRIVPSASAAPEHEAVLDPFAVYENDGEALLRRRLGALAAWHLVRIIEAYRLSSESPASLEGQPALVLIELIVRAVRSQESRLTGRPSH